MQECIDIVILWVDGNDPKWIEEKNKYLPLEEQDGRTNRYRDWGTLKYLFRGIEKYASWVNKVFLITCGHYPKWLNMKYEKLRLVRHDEFIPKECLPTFSSRAIDLNLHRIKELSEKFIYFNDDMFLTNYVTPNDFFKKDLPRDWFIETPIFPGWGIFSHTMLNNMEIINKYYNRKDTIKRNLSKIINPVYGIRMFYNLLWGMMPYKKFCGLQNNHLPMAYKKSTWKTVWEKEPEILNKTIHNKFRTITDVNQFLFNYWSLYNGEFYPTNMNKQGRLFVIQSLQNENLITAIIKNKYKRICINDECTDEVFKGAKEQLISAFETILSEKSMFEI